VNKLWRKNKMERKQAEQLARKVAELHTSKGIRALKELEEQQPDYKPAINAIREYIAKNFGRTQSERCWPGSLRYDGHPEKLADYLVSAA
jgi:hypothetical protein